MSYFSGERVTFENASQDSEYGSGFDEEKENEQKTKKKIPLTSMRSTFYQDQFVLALVELFLCHIASSSFVPIDKYFFEWSTAATLSTTASFCAHEYGLLAPLF